MEGDHNNRASKAVIDGAGLSRPYYECIFCKHGFTNAQALGGHMNIHRKDRGKAQRAPAMSVSKEVSEGINLEGYGYYNMYFHGTASDSRVAMDDGVVSRSHEELSIFGEDLCLGLSRQVDGGEEREVDLELRLGHQP